MDLVDEAAADEHRAPVAKRERTRVRDAGSVHLDIEAGRDLQLRRRQLVGGGRNRRRRDRHEFSRSFIVGGTADQRRTGRQWRSRARRWRWRGTGSWWARRLLGCGGKRECTEEGAGQPKAARRENLAPHGRSPWSKALFPRASAVLPPVGFLHDSFRYFPA